MYQKYLTDALVLSHRESGEADRVFSLFTEDFGLVRARASSVRAEMSKMRFSLQTGSRAHVTLVKGRRGWRLAGAASGTHTLHAAARVVISRIAQLVERLVIGEERNAYLFAALADAHEILATVSPAERGSVEMVCVARILFSLGYLSSEAVSSALLSHTRYAAEHLAEAEKEREAILASINRAIAAAQL